MAKKEQKRKDDKSRMKPKKAKEKMPSDCY